MLTTTTRYQLPIRQESTSTSTCRISSELYKQLRRQAECCSARCRPFSRESRTCSDRHLAKQSDSRQALMIPRSPLPAARRTAIHPSSPYGLMKSRGQLSLEHRHGRAARDQFSLIPLPHCYATVSPHQSRTRSPAEMNIRKWRIFPCHQSQLPATFRTNHNHRHLQHPKSR
jgi:hypothetical protein